MSFRLLPDGRLAQLAARGSEAAFSEIFRRYHQHLYRYANSILGNDDDARDAVQTSMVKLLDSLPGERRQIELKPWLFKIAHNEAISITRRRRERSLDSIPEPSIATDDADLKLRAQTLVADLGDLPDRQRSAVVMRELCGLSFKEIGVALSTSTAAAKQVVYEARQALQQLEAGREMTCDSARATISARDRRFLKGREIRAHLKSCGSCRDFEQGIRARREGLAAIAPLPLAAAHEMLQQILGSGAGPAGGLGVLGALGGAKAMGGGAALQVAAGAVVISGAAVGVATQATNLGGDGGEPTPAPTALVAANLGVTESTSSRRAVAVQGSGAEGTAARAIAAALGGAGGKLGSVDAGGDEAGGGEAAGPGDATAMTPPAAGPTVPGSPIDPLGQVPSGAGAGPPDDPGRGSPASSPPGQGKGPGKPEGTPGNGPASSPPGQGKGPGKPAGTPGNGPPANPGSPPASPPGQGGSPPGPPDLPKPPQPPGKSALPSVPQGQGGPPKLPTAPKPPKLGPQGRGGPPSVSAPSG